MRNLLSTYSLKSTKTFESLMLWFLHTEQVFCQPILVQRTRMRLSLSPLSSSRIHCRFIRFDLWFFCSFCVCNNTIVLLWYCKFCCYTFGYCCILFCTSQNTRNCCILAFILRSRKRILSPFHIMKEPVSWHCEVMVNCEQCMQCNRNSILSKYIKFKAYL